MNKLKLEFAKGGQGERARLFPILSENSKEGRAASIFLAVLQSVPEFADALLRPIGRPIGKRTKLVCRTELSLKTNPRLRPDGLLLIDTGHAIWSSLFEFKVGGELKASQIEDYLRLARDNNIDALITVSNDIVQDPTASPMKVDGRLTKSVSLYHFSWMHVFTTAELVLSENAISDVDQRMILEELGRFLSHSSTGIKGFESMPSEWPEVVSAVREKRPFRKNDERLGAVATAWNQEERDLGFVLSRATGKRCEPRIPRAHSSDPKIRVDHHGNTLSKDGVLLTSVNVPRAAADLDIEVDLRSRRIAVGMTLKAPDDRKRASASVNWLLRQIPSENAKNIVVSAKWPGRAPKTSASVHELMNGLDPLLSDRGQSLPVGFEISESIDLGARFESRKRFISELESLALRFYENVGQQLKAYVAMAPKVRESTAMEDVLDESKQLSAQLAASLEESLFE